MGVTMAGGRLGAARDAASVAVPALVAAAVVAVVWATLRGRLPAAVRLDAVSRALTVFGALLVAMPVYQIVSQGVATSRALGRSALVRELNKPVPLRAGAAAHAVDARGRRRDVYILLLDAYADPDVYRDRYHFDNRAFGDSLRALGFRVPTSVRSNYAHTLLSVNALLNFAHTRPIADVVDAQTRYFLPAARVLEHHRAARFMKERGYRFVYFPSGYYGPTLRNRDADVQFDPYAGFELGRVVRRSQYLQLFLESSPLRVFAPRVRSYNAVQTEHVRRTLAGVAALAARRDTAPVFAVAHVLMPHAPIFVDARCAPRPDTVPELLRNQVKCVSGWALETVRAILAASDPEPIIIVQGDHGPDQGEIGLVTPPTPEQLSDRFRPFGAYYLPDGGDAAIPDSLSVVNVLRYVFGYYFGADLPPVPDKMYFSHWQVPYRLREVGSDFHFVDEAPAPPPARAGIAAGR
jgi:hypothetical protein